MTAAIINSFLALLLSILFAGILIPQILLVSYRRKLFDEPDERKIHRGAVPRLGGIAFTPVICFSVSLLLGMAYLLGDIEIEYLMRMNAQSVAFGFCALLMLYLTGMADDLIGVRYRAKFIIQIFCAVLLVGGGLCIVDLHGVYWTKPSMSRAQARLSDGGSASAGHADGKVCCTARKTSSPRREMSTQ